MQNVTQLKDFDLITDNQIIGRPIEMEVCIFEFFGSNNVVYFGENVRLDKTSIRIYGNNNVIFLSDTKSNTLKLKIDIYNNSVFYIGKDCNTTQPLHIVLSEGKHIFIGDDCLFSFDIWMRNADPHLIYDANSMQRINPSKSVYIGDHVWVGQNVLLAKGTKIGSGSIIGAKSLTSSSLIPSNCSAGGVPCKVLKRDIFWRKPSVHAFDIEKTKSSNSFTSKINIYGKSSKQMDFNTIDKAIDAFKNAKDRQNYLYKNIYLNSNKNRFYIEYERGILGKSIFLFKKWFSKKKYK